MFWVEKGRGGTAVDWNWCTKLWGLGRQRREQRRAVNAQGAPRGAGGQCPSTGAASPLHGHRHQVTRLVAPRDVPFAGVMSLSSASCAWQEKPSARCRLGGALGPVEVLGLLQQSHLCAISLPKSAFGLLPSVLFPCCSTLWEKGSTTGAWIATGRFLDAGRCSGASAPALALAAFVNAPATRAARAQREMNFPLGTAKNDT